MCQYCNCPAVFSQSAIHIWTETVEWFVEYIKSPLIALCKLTLFWLYFFIMNIKIEVEVFIVEFWKNFPIALGAEIQWQVAGHDSVRHIPSSLSHTHVHTLIHPMILLPNIASDFVQIALGVKFNNNFLNLM